MIENTKSPVKREAKLGEVPVMNMVAGFTYYYLYWWLPFVLRMISFCFCSPRFVKSDILRTCVSYPCLMWQFPYENIAELDDAPFTSGTVSTGDCMEKVLYT